MSLKLSALVGLAMLLALGCRKPVTGPDPTDPGGTAAGEYYAVGRISNQNANIFLTIFEQDTLGQYGGEIRYLGLSSALAQIRATTAQDSVWFSYTRSSTSYSVWATINSIGLDLHHTEPQGVPQIFANRTVNGRNMTGVWSGNAASDMTGSQGTANLQIEQSGSLFFGYMTLALFETYTFNLTAGSSSQSAFQLAGRMTVQGTDYEVSVYGQYPGSDMVQGTWLVGPSGNADRGTFWLERRYE